MWLFFHLAFSSHVSNKCKANSKQTLLQVLSDCDILLLCLKFRYVVPVDNFEDLYLLPVIFTSHVSSQNNNEDGI